MENVFSVNTTDREIYTKAYGSLPYLVDSSGLSLCRRPRLWWFDWEIPSSSGYHITNPKTSQPTDYGTVQLEAPIYHPKDSCVLDGSLLIPLENFALSPRPSRATSLGSNRQALIPARNRINFKALWAGDRFRFPPYQYRFGNGVQHKRKGWRMLSIQEKEMIMGYPLDYTSQAGSKATRTKDPIAFDDFRHTLAGNSWHIGVVCALLQPLLCSQGLRLIGRWRKSAACWCLERHAPWQASCSGRGCLVRFPSVVLIETPLLN